jgi:hypothetical protein
MEIHFCLGWHWRQPAAAAAATAAVCTSKGFLMKQHAGNIGYAAALVDNSNRVIQHSTAVAQGACSSVACVFDTNIAAAACRQHQCCQKQLTFYQAFSAA